MRFAVASLLLAIALGLGAAVGIMPAAAQTFTEFMLAPASRPSAITTGPDGALWFTEAAGKIGRITIDGSITEFPIKGGGVLHSITTGPDGALWLTEFTAKKIGRIPTTATVENLKLTEFAIPGSTGPLGITTGPDGALWFTGRQIASSLEAASSGSSSTNLILSSCRGDDASWEPCHWAAWRRPSQPEP
ncbi:Vgb family protein [Bradyrhizobium sp. BR 1432]|uniref:Vgb family protein n=1 Tax=Bradyrhizobium sp. BR 1432 TaxID=3447966 RepID=UPI003EE72A07